RSGSYHRRRLASLERRLKRLGCSPVGFGQRTFSRILQQCLKEKRQTGSRSLLNTGMGLLPLSRLTPGHFATVIGSPASLHANVKSKAVSSPVRSSACTPTGDAKGITQCAGDNVPAGAIVIERVLVDPPEREQVPVLTTQELTSTHVIRVSHRS